MKADNALDAFDLLRKGKEKAKISATLSIINHFNEKLQESGEGPCKELELGVRRVVRGLGASKSSVRNGFYILLTGIIESFPSPIVTFDSLCVAINKELIDSYGSKADADSYIGQVLAFGALIHTSKIFEAEDEKIEEVILNLGSLARRRTYLKTAAYNFIVEFIHKLDDATFTKVWNVIQKEFLIQISKRTFHFYHLLIVLSKKFPNVVDEDQLIILMGSPKVVCKDSLKLITTVLLDQPNMSCINLPAYKEILRKLMKKRKLLKEFWSVYDTYLSSPTTFRMNLGLELFALICNEIKDKNLLKDLLTPNFVVLLETAQNVEFIEKARRKAIINLTEVLLVKDSIDKETLVGILEKLYFFPGTFQFFAGHGARVYNALLNSFDEDTVKQVTKLFSNVITDKSQKIVSMDAEEPTMKPWKQTQKRRAIDNIVKLITHPVVNNISWKVESLKIIIDNAFFSKSVPPFLCDAAQKSFYGCLDHKFARFSDMRSYINGIVHYLDEKLSSSNYCKIEFSNDKRKAWRNMITTADSIEENGKVSYNVFKVMFPLLGISMFKNSKNVVENLNELHSVYKHMTVDVGERNDEPHWTDVIIDLFLSLLSNDESQFYRNAISKVFIYLCPELSSQNIHQLLHVLKPESNNIMSETGKIEEDTDSDTTEDMNNDEQDLEEEEKTSSSDDDEEEEDDDDDGTDYDRLRAVLRDALGTSAALTDTESIDLDDLDEEEGKKVDANLSEAFREMKQAKLKVKAAEEKELTDFRLRVLNLLEIWLRTEPDLNIILDVMVTLMNLLEMTIKEGVQIELQNRIRSFLTKLTTVKDFKLEGFTASNLPTLMEQLLEKGERTAVVYISLTPQIVECCTFLLKISLRDIKHIKKTRSKILNVYKNALTDMLTKRNSIMPIGLFNSACNLCWQGNFILAQEIVECITNPQIRLFNQSQGLHLLQLFFRNKRFLTREILEKYQNELQEMVRQLSEISGTFVENTKQHHQFMELVKIITKLGIKVNVHQHSGKSRKRKSEEEFKESKIKKHAEDEMEESTENISESVEEKKECDQEDATLNAGSKSKKINGTSKKHKKYTEAMTSKKKSKLLRVQESSKGIDDALFQNLSSQLDSGFVNGQI